MNKCVVIIKDDTNTYIPLLFSDELECYSYLASSLLDELTIYTDGVNVSKEDINKYKNIFETGSLKEIKSYLKELTNKHSFFIQPVLKEKDFIYCNDVYCLDSPGYKINGDTWEIFIKTKSRP